MEGMVKLKFPVFAVVGEKNSGKTRLIEALTRLLGEKGVRVGVVKHIPHKDFTVDRDGKDSWRYAKAGAKTVFCVSPNEITVIRKLKDADEKFENFLRFAAEDEFDCLFVEGFKGKLKDYEDIPKIVTAKNFDEALKLLTQLKNVFCVVSSSPPKTENLKILSLSFNETEKILKLIEEEIEVYKILRRLPGLDCGFCGFKSCFEHAKAIYEKKSTLEKCPIIGGEKKISLKIGDEEVPLNPFIQNLFKNIVLAMVSSLKGVNLKNKKTITVTLRSIE